MDFVILFFTAAFISLAGQLPLGNMNMTATQLSVQEGFKKAWQYGIGIAIVEMIYLRIALTGMNWVVNNKTFFTFLGWLTVAVFLLLGMVSFIAAQKQQTEKKGLLLNNKLHRFILGISISAINPAQIPFWFIWVTFLVDKQLLHSNFTEFNIFTAGAGLGTIAGIAVYIHGGNWAITKMKASNKALNYFMSAVFIITSLIQLYKMLYNPWTGGL
jgi:threonine/homoserine/homoserine lactone efflux protein